jgi:hypothetical protein
MDTVGDALFVSTTSSKLVHDPFVIVHLNVTLKPAFRLVIVVVGELMLVITAPLAGPIIVQMPVPGAAAFPARVKVDVLHCSAFGPALAAGGVALLVSTTSSKLVQDPFVIVHLNVTLFPAVSPVTVLVANAGVVIAAPLAAPMILQSPVPVTAAFPANVKLAVLHSSWSAPALDTVGDALLVSTTSSKLVHDPFVMVHLKVTLKPALRLVIVVVGELMLVITAPLAAPWTVQVPVPGAAAFPASVKIDVLHCSIFGPALAAGGVALLVSTTSSKLVHDPFVIVHLKVILKPAFKPVTVLASDAGVVMVAPLTAPMIDQTPVPIAAAFPLNVKLPTLH